MDDFELQRKSTLEAEPSDPFRYPEGVQFYHAGGYDTANKFDKLTVTLDGGHQCWNEAMPDICLRADEGNLEEVRRIVEAAAAVSDEEKRRTVNKARKWVKFTFHQSRMPSCVERYDGTALSHA